MPKKLESGRFLAFRDQPRNMCFRIGNCIFFCFEDLIRVLGYGIPPSSVFGIPTKLLDAERPVEAKEYVDTVIAFRALERNDDGGGHGCFAP